MSTEEIEKFAGENIKVTTIDNSIFEGLLFFVEFEDEKEEKVAAIHLDTYEFGFLMEDIQKIELL